MLCGRARMPRRGHAGGMTLRQEAAHGAVEASRWMDRQAHVRYSLAASNKALEANRGVVQLATRMVAPAGRNPERHSGGVRDRPGPRSPSGQAERLQAQ